VRERGGAEGKGGVFRRHTISGLEVEPSSPELSAGALLLLIVTSAISIAGKYVPVDFGVGSAKRSISPPNVCGRETERRGKREGKGREGGAVRRF
jgi:hypothetical protein